ncbi:hypothetical protein BpHYR1_040252 [Brachionus plicatilis]|uniref:Uncharacterized protein n=1 Tax=Brachionus plicatilis TaxID=10195 RepID=A0A3M7RS52_BRAPC|nr:hypothetical protein BpHYR1_040252 [Brachionus plicatilis]
MINEIRADGWQMDLLSASCYSAYHNQHFNLVKLMLENFSSEFKENSLYFIITSCCIASCFYTVAHYASKDPYQNSLLAFVERLIGKTKATNKKKYMGVNKLNPVSM